MKRIYKTDLRGLLCVILLFLVLLLPLTFSLYVETDFSDSSRNMGLLGFWLMIGLIIAFVASFRAEIDDFSVTSYFLNFKTYSIRAANVQSVESGYFTRYGTSLKVQYLKDGKVKKRIIPQGFLPDAFIDDAQKVLESGIKN